MKQKPSASYSVKPLTLPKEFNFQKRASEAKTSSNSTTNQSTKLTAPLKNPLIKNTRKLNELTVPQSPFLLTKMRSKPSKILPTTEQEYEEFLKIQPFVAQPILSLEPHPRVNKLKRELTVPVSPAITKMRKRGQDMFEKVNTGGVRKSIRLLRKKALPKFDISKQLESIAQKASEKIKDKVDDAFNPFKPVLNTKPFKATSFNSIEKQPLPSIVVKQPTLPQPFSLVTEERGHLYNEYMEEKLAFEEYEQFKNRQFKASGMWDGEFFIPEKSNKEETIIEPFNLHSELRGVDRKAFDDDVKKREAYMIEMKESYLKQVQEQEEKEVQCERKKRVHVAQSIPNYQLMTIKASDKKLTLPVSPFIGKKRRHPKSN